MSCGDDLETPCAEVLDHLYAYLDHELPTADSAQIARHMDECGPCLREYGLEEVVRSLVRRSCHESAPASLRSRVLVSIAAVRVELRQPGPLVPDPGQRPV